MKYFVDTEFVDDGHTIDLISIGIVCEDRRELYLQSAEFDVRKASVWVHEHVFPSLVQCVAGWPQVRHTLGQCTHSDCAWRTRSQIANEIEAFCDPEKNGRIVPELWGWCCSRDHVALSRLFGAMGDAPFFWPHYMRDIQYLLDERGVKDAMLIEQIGTVHNALADAHYAKLIWEEYI